MRRSASASQGWAIYTYEVWNYILEGTESDDVDIQKFKKHFETLLPRSPLKIQHVQARANSHFVFAFMM